MSQLMGAKRGPIIAVNFSGLSSFAQGLDQAVGEVFKIFLEIELPMRDEAGVVIQESKEKTLSYLSVDDHRRAMHAVGLPDVIGEFRFIPPEIRFETLGFIETPPLEESIEARDGGMKVGRQKLSLPGHTDNHGKGSGLEFAL